MDIEAKLEYIIFENKANHYVVAGFSELKIQLKIRNMCLRGII